MKRIKPYEKFWIDCYNSILSSIYNTYYDYAMIDIYQNNYWYEVKTIMSPSNNEVSIYKLISDNQWLRNKIFYSVNIYTVREKSALIDWIEYANKREKNIVVSVDLEYWIKEKEIPVKNRKRYLMIVDFDLKSDYISIMERGSRRFGVYEFPLDFFFKAFAGSGGHLEIITLKANISAEDIQLINIAKNGCKINQNINELISNSERCWKINNPLEENVDFIARNMILFTDTVKNRQIANRYLCEKFSDQCNVNPIINKFKKIETCSEMVKNEIYKKLITKKLSNDFGVFQSKIIDLLKDEKDIWTLLTNYVYENCICD